MAIPQKAQQKEQRKSSVHILQWKVQKHYRKDIPDEVYLLELRQYTKKVVVSYLVYKEYGKQEYYIKENREQGVISRRKLEELKQCRYLRKEERKVVHLKEGKVQQSSAQARALEGIVKEKSSQREIRKTFKMLRKVQLNIGVEKIDTCKSVAVKVLLNSGTMGVFMDRRTVIKYRFKLQKLERSIPVRNVNRTNNSKGAITYQVKVNVYYKGHIEKIRMDICNLEKTEVILGILWL